MIWPNELALLMLSIMSSPSDEMRAFMVLVAIVVWFFAACAPVIAGVCLFIWRIEK